MSKAQQQETAILEQFLLTSGNKDTPKVYFKHYWPAFSAHFQAVTNFEPKFISQQYQIAFARLRTELKAEKNLLGDGTLWSKFLLVGHDLLAGGQPLSTTVIEKNKYLDSDLLLIFLATQNEYFHKLVKDTYASAFWAIAREQFGSGGAAAGAMKGTEAQDLFSDTYATLLEKINAGKVVSPMSSTVSSYAYKIYEFKVRAAYRKDKEGDPSTYSTEYFESPPPPPAQNYWEELLVRFNSLKRYDFHDEKNFAYFLLGLADEQCRKLITRHYIDGAVLSSIALELGIPEKGIKSQAKRCRDSIKAQVKHPDHG